MKSSVIWSIYIFAVVASWIVVFGASEAVPTLNVEEVAPTQIVWNFFRGKKAVSKPYLPSNSVIKPVPTN